MQRRFGERGNDDGALAHELTRRDERMELRAMMGIPSPYPFPTGNIHPLPVYERVKYFASAPYPFHRVWIWGTGKGTQRQHNVYIMSNSNVRGDIDDIICVGERHATTSKIIDIYNAT